MKKLLLASLIFLTVFTFGCGKDDSLNDMIKLNKIDISSLSNSKIKKITDDNNLKEGAYIITTKSNTYLYFLGIENEFTDISCNLEDNILNINSSLNKKDNTNELSKKMFVLYQKNTTSSDKKINYFNTIKLTINGKESNFNSYIIE